MFESNAIGDRQRRRFWAVTAFATLIGPLVAVGQREAFSPVAAATLSLGIVVLLSWLAESSAAAGWQVRAALFVAGASAAASFLPWQVELIVWLAVLGFAVVAVENPPNAPALCSVAGETKELATEQRQLDETDDPSVVASLVRRIVDGVETVEGVFLASGDGPAHVVFHPPLSTTPEIELYELDECEPRLSEATPYGFRATTRQRGRIAFSASAPAA